MRAKLLLCGFCPPKRYLYPFLFANNEPDDDDEEEEEDDEEQRDVDNAKCERDQILPWHLKCGQSGSNQSMRWKQGAPGGQQGPAVQR